MKQILITGGARGIGLAACKEFSKIGKVYSLDVHKPDEAQGTTLQGITFLKADITKASDIQQALRKIPGRIDVLFNNAGVLRRGTIYDSTEKDWQIQFAVNLKAAWLMLKLARGKLRTDATIIQMASKHGLDPKPDPAVYCLTKVGMVALAEIVQETNPEYRVKLVCPGAVDTKLHATGRTKAHIAAEKRKGVLISPAELAKKIVRLAMGDRTRLVYSVKQKKYIYS